MTHLPVVYADPEDIIDPETVPGLRYNRTTWWYEAGLTLSVGTACPILYSTSGPSLASLPHLLLSR